MRIFEFSFNPKKHKDRFFDVYSFEPQKPAEKAKGSLYVIGELQHALEFQGRFLRKLAETVQQEYYSSSLKSTDAAFKAALKKANLSLQEEGKKGNLDWLGNLHVAILLFVTTAAKKKTFHLAKTGSIKVYLNRQGGLVDTGKNLEMPSPASPGKVFLNIVSTTLVPDDTISVMSRDLHDFFSKEKSLSELTMLKEAKGLKQFFQRRQKIVQQLSGVVFQVVVEEVQANTSRFRQKKLLALPFPISLPKEKLMLPKKLPTKIAFPSFKLPSLRNPAIVKKKGAVLLLFLALLGLGFLLFQGERRAASKEAANILSQIEQMELEAENALIFQDEETANKLLQQAYVLAGKHTGKDTPYAKTFLAKQEELAGRLAPLNSLRIIQGPELVVELPREGTSLIPQRMILHDGKLYLYNPFASQLAVYSLNGESLEVLSAPRNLKLGAAVGDSLVFFAEPNILLELKSDNTWNEISVSFPSGGFTPTHMAVFEQSLYLFESKTGRIVKYAAPLAGGTAPRDWLVSRSLKTPSGAISFAIDGNIWALAQGSEVQRYFTGAYQESLNISLFPEFSGMQILRTSSALPNLYVLDPSGQRIVVITKFGELLFQVQSPAFDKLLDVAVDGTSKTMYVLSGTSVYRVPEAAE